MTITTDLSTFGYRELGIARDLLDAYINRDDSVLGEGVHVAFNVDSGYVFLADEDYNTAMIEKGRLVDFHNSPYDGLEGTLEDLADELEWALNDNDGKSWNGEDIDWFVDTVIAAQERGVATAYQIKIKQRAEYVLQQG